MPELQGQPDEVVFNYAVAKNAVIVTRDLDFTNPFKFDHRQLHGLVILRFPNEISIKRLIDETSDLIADIEEDDFRSLIIIAPGSVRKRKFIV